MYDVFGLWRLMRWVQVALGLLAAFGLLAGLGGIATGKLHRAPPLRGAQEPAGARAAAPRAPGQLRPLPTRLPPRQVDR
jgi:hypothetical protein